MSVSHQRSLPGINPGNKGYLSFTESVIDPDADVTFGGALATDPAITALQHGMLTCTPGADRTWTLPTAVTLLANLTQYTNIDVGDGFAFIIRNLAAAASGRDITLNVGVGIALDANSNNVIGPQRFSKFILRCDDPNPLAGSADFELFQVDSGTINEGISQLASVGDATANTTTLAAQPAFEFLDNAVLIANGVLSGITITGPNAGGTSTLTFSEAGNYKVTYHVAGELTTLTAVGGITEIGIAVGLDAAVPTVPMASAMVDAALTNPGLNMTGVQIINVPLGTEALNLYVAGITNIALADVLTTSNIQVTIEKV